MGCVWGWCAVLRGPMATDVQGRLLKAWVFGRLGFLIPHCVRNDKVGGGGVYAAAAAIHHRRSSLSAEGWVAFGAAGLFVAGQVAYL